MKDFILKVQEMRELQKKYFKTKDKTTLLRSKQLEKEVDGFIYQYLSNQIDLF